MGVSPRGRVVARAQRVKMPHVKEALVLLSSSPLVLSRPSAGTCKGRVALGVDVEVVARTFNSGLSHHDRSRHKAGTARMRRTFKYIQASVPHVVEV